LDQRLLSCLFLCSAGPARDKDLATSGCSMGPGQIALPGSSPREALGERADKADDTELAIVRPC